MHSATVEPDETSDTDQRKRNKEVYEAATRAVDKQSGHYQPPLATRASVYGALHTAGYGPYGLEELQTAIRAACYNGNLFRAEDADGNRYLGIDDTEVLCEKIETHLSRRENPSRDIIGLANRRVQQLRSDSNE